MSSKNTRARERTDLPTGLGHSAGESDLAAVADAIHSIQRPAPLDPDWAEELGPDWERTTVHALRTLLQVQVDQEIIPDEIWDGIMPSSRAGFLRNTLVGALSNYRKLVARQTPQPPLHDLPTEGPTDVPESRRGEQGPRPPASFNPTE